MGLILTTRESLNCDTLVHGMTVTFIYKHLCIQIGISGPKAMPDLKKEYWRENWAMKVTGLQPAVLIKNILRLRCFPVSFHKFLKNVFHRTPLGECFLKLYFQFIMACKWRIARQWSIVFHKYININQSMKSLSDSMWFRGQMLT